MNGCAIEGCPEPHRARGYCNTHYRRWRRHGDPLHLPTRTWDVNHAARMHRDGWPVPEIAAEMGVSADAIRSARRRYAQEFATPASPRRSDAWRHEAACADHDADLFAPGHPQWRHDPDELSRIRAAIAVCGHCPVSDECAAVAERGQEWGVWGGRLRTRGRAVRLTPTPPPSRTRTALDRVDGIEYLRAGHRAVNRHQAAGTVPPAWAVEADRRYQQARHVARRDLKRATSC